WNDQQGRDNDNYRDENGDAQSADPCCLADRPEKQKSGPLERASANQDVTQQHRLLRIRRDVTVWEAHEHELDIREARDQEACESPRDADRPEPPVIPPRHRTCTRTRFVIDIAVLERSAEFRCPQPLNAL